MQEIAVVKRRARIWPVVLLLLLVALAIFALLWMTGYFQPEEFNFNVLNLTAPTAPVAFG